VLASASSPLSLSGDRPPVAISPFPYPVQILQLGVPRGCAPNELYMLVVVFFVRLAVVLLVVGGTVLVGLVTTVMLPGMMM